GKAVRPYSTFDFGRERDPACISVVVRQGKAEALVRAVREALPSGLVAFIGTTNWLGEERHWGVEVSVGEGRSQLDIVRLARTDACNCDLDTEDIVDRLQRYDSAFGIDIFHAETDTVEFRLIRLPSDL